MKRALLALCALIVVSNVVGKKRWQEPGPTSLTLHVTTHLVQVNVIVLDHHGNPVSGLTREDFKVFDNGKPQKVTIFRVESNRPPASVPKLPPNAFSNYAERAGYAPPSVTVILLDALNTPLAAQIYARQQVVKFLEQLQPNDHVALYALANQLEILHDFTTDSSELLEALGHYNGKYVGAIHNGEPQGGFPKMGAGGTRGSLGAGSESAQLDHWMGNVQGLENRYYTEQRVRITTDALIAIANHLEGLPGRKNLVWVSAGFPFWNSLDQTLKPNAFTNQQDFHSPLARAARALNNVNLAIDPVDARGLMVTPGFSVTHHSVPSTQMPVRFEDSFATMDELAERTGGRAFYNTNGIRRSIRRVLDDSRVNYVLGYYPQDVKWNGAFRKIKVQVDRRGVRLQYRHGYSAMPEERAPAGERTQSLDAVVNSPLEATGIGLAVQMLPDKSVSAPAYILRLQIDPKDITFQEQDGLWVASMTLVTDEFGPRGKNLRGAVQKVQLHLKPEIFQKVLVEGMGFGERLQFPILYNAERLRVVIRDDPTGRMGSANVPLDRALLPAKPTFTKRNQG